MIVKLEHTLNGVYYHICAKQSQMLKTRYEKLFHDHQLNSMTFISTCFHDFPTCMENFSIKFHNFLVCVNIQIQYFRCIANRRVSLRLPRAAPSQRR